MVEPTSDHEENAEPHNAANEQGEPQETPQEGGLPEVSKTVKDVRTLWGKAVPPDASPGSSIKAGGIGAGLEAASKLLPRLRRLSKAKEEKEKPEESDFELIELLGKGGMGMVFLARQKSLDREVAVKVIQPKAAEDAEARGKFFAEALVTGELDHPNIVPVYDFGGTPDGVLFYPMKQVRGTSWDKVIQQKSLEENLSILNSVCDAVAFAHDKGVIHRDLKPENVMLGDYGEVFVMDWGLAASVGMKKAEKLTAETGFAGTPAYMAPEMAKCEPTKIGPASDIYLLGGILYEIATGLRPHTGDDVYSCIHAAMENVIQPTEKKGELTEIALKAMATEPQERHKSVKDFQRVVREYRSHAESLKLSAAADERLSRVKEKPKTEVYRELTETIAGYQQAIELWSHNEAAIGGLRKARETFVEVALERGDLALAQSQVTAMEEECGKFVLREKRLESPKGLAEKVSLAVARAARKEKIARLSRRAALSAASLVLIVSLTAYFITRAARDRTELALGREEKQRQRAEEALRRAERENYYNVIALASARIADSRFDQAESLLWDTPGELRGWEWGRLMQLCHQDLLTLKGHSDEKGHLDELRSVAFSPEGKRVVTGSADKTAKIWDAESGQDILTLKGHSSPVFSVAFSPDAKRVATGSFDSTAKIWDAESGQEILTLNGHSDRVSSVAFSPDGKRVVTGSYDGTAKIWDAESGQEILTLKGHLIFVVSVAFSPDGKRVVTGSADKTAKIWDAESGQEILTLKGHSDRVSSVAFSPDGKRVVTASWDKTAKIWDAESGQEILTLNGHSSPVFSVAFSPDGKRVVTGSFDKTAKIWDAESGQEILTLKGHSGYVFSGAFSPDGKRVVTGSADKTAKIWDVESGQDVLTLRGHSSSVVSVAFSPDGKRVVTGSYDGTAEIWDAESGQEILTLRGHSREVYSVAFSPGGKRLVTASWDRTAEIWDAESGQEILTLKGHSGSVVSVAFSPDGKRVVTGSFDKTAKIWDAESGQEILTLKGHSDRVSSVAFSPDGKRVVTASWDKTAKIWDAESGQEILTLKGHSEGLTPVAFSPDGKRVVTASWDKTAKIWDAESGQEILTLKGHLTFAVSVAFSPDGKRVVTANVDNTAEIWDAESGQEILTLRGHSSSVVSVAFSPDGKRVATASYDGTAKIWDSFDRDLTPKKLDEKRRERYKRWLERNREARESGKAGVLASGVEVLQDTNANVYNELAWSYVTKKIKPQEAVSLAKKAVELAPTDTNILDTLGWAYLRNGQFAEALETFRKILVSQPGPRLSFSGWRAVAEIARSSVEGGVFLRFCDDMNELSKSMADKVASEHTLLWVHGVLAQFHEHRGEKEKADQEWRKTGFVKTSSWLVIGPFDSVAGSDFFKPYPPEQSIDLHATYQARGTKIGWAELNPDSYGAFVDLEEVLDDNRWAVAYAFARVHSAQEMQAQLRVGSDDDVKVWLNGKEVLRTNVARVAVIDQDVVPVNLKGGTNEILLKVCNRAGGWGFHLRITDSQGRPLEGLGYIPAAELRSTVPE